MAAYVLCSDPWVFTRVGMEKCDDPAVIFLSLSGPATRRIPRCANGGLQQSEEWASARRLKKPQLHPPVLTSTIPALPRGSFFADFATPTQPNDIFVKVSYATLIL